MCGVDRRQRTHLRVICANPLTDDTEVIVLMHGNELLTVTHNKEKQYEEAVQRMRCYADQGVKFKVCVLTLQDYGYAMADMRDFIDVATAV